MPFEAVTAIDPFDPPVQDGVVVVLTVGLGFTVIVNVLGVPEQVAVAYVIVTRPFPVFELIAVVPSVTPPV